MKVSLNWLREYVELPASTGELCELLTLAGVEVEGIESSGVSIDHVIIAQILDSLPHPNADRLSVCKVDDGSGAPRQIVCGAKNYKVGDKVPLALPGAVLPDPAKGAGAGFTIKVGKLRGIESHGMMCSEKELGIAEDAAGLLILPPDSKVGDPISALFPPDTVLDLEITPNRADLLSYRGMAREIAALTGKTLVKLNSSTIEGTVPESIEVRIEALQPCPFYSARKIGQVKIAPSPLWLRQKLEAAGLRAINNIVDITNLVMLETGQPLHAFDADKLRGGIQVRMAGATEEFAALDGRTYKLNPGHLVIADAERAVAIAGVMGGEETGVTDTTANIILESAYFQPASVRRTARELGLSSDSSYRFERGVDPEGVIQASDRAAALILELAGGQASSLNSTGALPDFTRTVPFCVNRCGKILGTEIAETETTRILSALGLEKASNGWNVPSFRQDLTREIDLVEEVARVYGLERIPAREICRFAPSSHADHVHDSLMQLRRTLIGMGFFEARNVSLIPGKADYLFESGSVQHVRNPLGEDQSVLRPSLLPSLMHTVAHNARAGFKNMRFFEVGRVFREEPLGERLYLALVMTGSSTAQSWRNTESRMMDFFDLKGVLAGLGLGDLKYQPETNSRLALSLAIDKDNQPVGHAGLLWPAKARELDIVTQVVVSELDLSAMGFPAKKERKVREISRCPAATRDIAMIVPSHIRHEEVMDLLQKTGETLLESVELFDLFADPTGKNIPIDCKSIAYSLTFRAKNRTLTAEETNAALARLKESLKAQLKAVFRE